MNSITVFIVLLSANAVQAGRIDCFLKTSKEFFSFIDRFEC